MIYEIINDAFSLPDEWDNIAECYFQRKKFLLHIQYRNYCKQKYYLAFEGNKLAAGAVVYTLKLDLFTYSKFKLPIKVQVTGIPCSVSCGGLIGSHNNTSKLYEYICSVEKGLCLALNLKGALVNPHKIIIGKTLPTIVFKNQFTSWEEYLNRLRSDYRHRIKLIEDKSYELISYKSPCLEFNEIMYNQYLQVHNKSEAKLEKLDYNFFKYLPDDFCLTSIKRKDLLVGWYITLHSDNRLYFFLGGLDYSYNEKYGTYLKILTDILRSGISLRVESIELGQTAEIPKMRLGGISNPLSLAVYHQKQSFRFLLRSGIKILEYNNKVPQSNVFKEQV